MQYPRPRQLTQIVDHQKDILKGKRVLDIACNQGLTTAQIAKYAERVTAFDIRADQVKLAPDLPNVQYLVGDALDESFITPLLLDTDVVMNCGMFYHLFNHFGYLELVCKPHIEYVVIETIYGPESSSPGMFWDFEDTSITLNGSYRGLATIPNGTPNLAWIMKAANVFNFGVDYVEKFLTDYPGLDSDSNKRMVVRLFNKALPKKSLTIEETWEWDTRRLICQT